jgi:hypothetical protein
VSWVLFAQAFLLVNLAGFWLCIAASVRRERIR